MHQPIDARTDYKLGITELKETSYIQTFFAWRAVMKEGIHTIQMEWIRREKGTEFTYLNPVMSLTGNG